MTEPREIEVFRAGTRASRGITADQIAEVATYDCSEKPVALCFGHPKSDTPAAGHITKFRADGNSLYATVSNLTQKAIDGIKSGEWLDRSMAFFDPNHEANPEPGKWRPRHVGLLGAPAPGIPGMTGLRKALAFDADGGLIAEGEPADALVYAGAPTPIHFIFEAKEPRMTDTPNADADAAAAARDKELTDRETAFAARIKSQFEASNGSAIDALVREGKVLPAEADGLKLAFNALDPEGDELTFGAGDKTIKATAAAHILSFIAGLDKRVPLGKRESPVHEFSADAPKTATDFTARAKKLAEEKGLTFDAAAEQLGAEMDAA